MKATSVQTYTGCNHVLGKGIHIATSNPFVKLYDIDGKRWWLMEWHYFCGPTALSKRTQDPLRNQPGERSRFWQIVVWWKDQGCKVVDGVGQWTQPPRLKTVAFDRVQGEFWDGYQHWGLIPNYWPAHAKGGEA